MSAVDDEPSADGVPNFLSTECPPTGAWLAVQNALTSFLHIDVDGDEFSGDDLHVFAETLGSPRLHALVGAIGYATNAHADICAYATGIAKNKRADMLEERRQQHFDAMQLFPDYGTRRLPTTGRARCYTQLPNIDAVEDATISCIDARARKALTSRFDLEEFWRDVREWCGRLYAEEFGPFVPTGRVLSRQEIAELPVTPQEGTWMSLLSGRRPTMEIHFDTTPEEVFAHEYEAVYRAFFRNRPACPVNSPRNGDVLVGDGR